MDAVSVSRTKMNIEIENYDKEIKLDFKIIQA